MGNLPLTRPTRCFHVDKDAGTPSCWDGCPSKKDTLPQPDNEFDELTAEVARMSITSRVFETRQSNEAQMKSASEDEDAKTRGGLASSSQDPTNRLDNASFDHPTGQTVDATQLDGGDSPSEESSPGEALSDNPRTQRAAPLASIAQRVDLEDTNDVLQKKGHLGSGDRNDAQVDLWMDRIRLISQCATSTETIVSLTADVKYSKSLLTDTIPSYLDFEGDPEQETRSRVARDQDALEERLEAEKTLLTDKRELLARMSLREPHVSEPRTGREKRSFPMEDKENMDLGVDRRGGGSGKLRSRSSAASDRWTSIVAEDMDHHGQDEDEGEKDNSDEAEEEDEDEIGEEGTALPLVVREQETRPPHVDGGKTAQRDLSRTHMTELIDTARMMKYVLYDIRQMAHQKSAHNQIQSGLTTRERPQDEVEGVEEQPAERSTDTASSLCLPEASPTTQEIQSSRMDIERCVSSLSDLHNDLKDLRSDTYREDIIQDCIRSTTEQLVAKRAKANTKGTQQAQHQLEAVCAEVKVAFEPVQEQIVNLDAQAGEVTGAVTRLISQVHSLEEQAAEGRKERNETRRRLEQIKSGLALATGIKERNRAHIATLQEAIDAYSPPTPVIYPSTRDIALALIPAILEAARPHLDSMSSEVNNTLTQTNTTIDHMMLTCSEEELAVHSLLSQSGGAALQSKTPSVREHHTRGDNIMTTRPPPSVSSPSSPYVSPPIPPPSNFVQQHSQVRRPSCGSLRYTPPPNDHRVENNDTSSSDAFKDTSRGPSPSLLFVEDCSTGSAQSDTFSRREASTSSTTTAENSSNTDDNTSVRNKLDCAFLVDPKLLGIPIRLQPIDEDLRVGKPFVFVKTILSDNGDQSDMIVEVKDCRKGRSSGKIYQFPLDALCYVPPTTKHQTVICTAPGVNRAQQYYVLAFDAEGACLVRKDPKVPKAKRIAIATRLLAQVAPPIFATLPYAPAQEAASASEMPKKLATKIKRSVAST